MSRLDRWLSPAKAAVAVSAVPATSSQEWRESAAGGVARDTLPAATSRPGGFQVAAGSSEVATSKPAEIQRPPRQVAETAETADGASPEADFEERAALVEHEAGAPRAWAEGLALLHPDRPPPHVSPHRWLTFCDDAGAFIDRWAPQAAALGWSTVEVFGVHRTRPVERFDGAGLVWALNGSTVEALTADVVTVRTPHGTRQTIRRRPDNAANERVIAWEIER